MLGLVPPYSALLLRRKHVAARPSARQSNIVQDPHISKEDDIYRDVSEEVVAGRTDDDNEIGLKRCIVLRLEEMASDQERQNSLVITSCFFTALSSKSCLTVHHLQETAC